jgi:hypothetical protein
LVLGIPAVASRATWGEDVHEGEDNRKKMNGRNKRKQGTRRDVRSLGREGGGVEVGRGAGRGVEKGG